jgi:hypothetical protein
MATHKGECFCGSIKIEVVGEPEGMVYCHRQSSWSAAPVNAFAIWKTGAVRVTGGAEHVATFQKTPRSQRQYCRKCGGHVMTVHPAWGLIDVDASMIPTVKFVPGLRTNYAETVLPMRDGLPS